MGVHKLVNSGNLKKSAQQFLPEGKDIGKETYEEPIFKYLAFMCKYVFTVLEQFDFDIEVVLKLK